MKTPRSPALVQDCRGLLCSTLRYAFRLSGSGADAGGPGSGGVPKAQACFAQLRDPARAKRGCSASAERLSAADYARNDQQRFVGLDGHRRPT